MTVFSWSTTAANNDDSDSTVNWREGQSPGSVNNSARAMMAALAKFRDDAAGNLVTAGTSTAYTLTTNQVFTALTDGIAVTARMDETSGAAPTLNLDGLGAKSIAGVYGTAIPTGYLRGGGVYTFVYDSTDDKFIVHGYAGHTVPLSEGGTGAVLADPGADRIAFWDDSAGAVTWLVPSTGLAISTTNLALSHLGLEALSDPGADRMFFWDDSETAAKFLQTGDGVEISGTTLQANIASQAEMETGSATDVVVPVGRLHYHPASPKAWGEADADGNINADYGVSSVTDHGTGDITWTWDTAFSSGGYSAVPGARETSGSNIRNCYLSSQDVTNARIQCVNATPSVSDPDSHYIVALGDV
jgi:hypothetical protein